MSKRMGKTFFTLGVALMLVTIACSSAWAAQPSHHASRPGAKPESVAAAAVGGPEERPALSRAAKSQAGREGPLPVLRWDLLKPNLYIFHYNMKGLNWHQVRDQREARQNAWQNKKNLKLQFVKY